MAETKKSGGDKPSNGDTLSIPESIKELTELVHREWNEVKEKAEGLLAKVPDADKLSEYDELFEKFDQRFNQLEAAAKRVRQQSEADGFPIEAKAHADDFHRFLRKESTERSQYRAGQDVKTTVQAVPRYKTAIDGRNVLEFEYKALSVDSDPAGGFLVSPTMATTVIQRVFDTSPMRQYAMIETISGDAYEEIVDDDELTVGWVGEQQARPETTTPALDQLRIPLNEIYAKPKSTQKMLDMRSSVEDWLSGKVSDKFAREEATQFVTGDGVMKPKGITTYANAASSWNLVKQVVSGSASTLTPNGLIDIKADLQEFYLPNSRWFMNRTTRSVVRKFRYDAVTANDEAGGFMWEPGLKGGDPDLLLGHPLAIFEDMPAIAADANALGFGDLREGYLIIDHTTNLKVLRDPYSSKPYVEFYTTKYVGGAVRQGRALRLQKIST